MKNWKPIVKYSDKFLDAISWFMRIGGISLFPFVILREKYQNGDKFWVERGKRTINHESIHFQQQLELLIIPFYIIYLLEWFFKLFIYGHSSIGPYQ